LRELRNSAREVTGSVREATSAVGEAKELGKEEGIDPSRSPAAVDPERGSILVSKITNLPVYAQPRNKSSVVARVLKSDELVYIGEASGEYLHVASDKGDGWVERVFVRASE